MPRRTIAAAAILFASMVPIPAQAEVADEPVYHVIHQQVRDETRFAAYVDAVMPAIARIGGELVAAGEAFLSSGEYARIRAHRVGAADWLASIVPALPVGSEQ